MIGSLTGIVTHKQPPWMLLDVGGVGYELEAPMSTFYDLPSPGEKTTLLTHLVVREDAQLLYGFSHENQRALFRSLLKVNGVGPRVALAILSTFSAEEFQDCVIAEDAVQITRVPGIGRKTAERLLVEMRDKVDGMFDATGTDTPAGRGGTATYDPAVDAISALVALGYKPAEATRQVRALHAGPGSEELIREALKNMARKS